VVKNKISGIFEKDFVKVVYEEKNCAETCLVECFSIILDRLYQQERNAPAKTYYIIFRVLKLYEIYFF